MTDPATNFAKGFAEIDLSCGCDLCRTEAVRRFSDLVASMNEESAESAAVQLIEAAAAAALYAGLDRPDALERMGAAYDAALGAQISKSGGLN